MGGSAIWNRLVTDKPTWRVNTRGRPDQEFPATPERLLPSLEAGGRRLDLKAIRGVQILQSLALPESIPNTRLAASVNGLRVVAQAQRGSCEAAVTTLGAHSEECWPQIEIAQ